ncbi:MAG: hypothetical protein M3478_08445 [Planctomycetota bacterium]|nr:hypothetical protein [Planctomycetota bacterium]
MGRARVELADFGELSRAAAGEQLGQLRAVARLGFGQTRGGQLGELHEHPCVGTKW